MPFDKHASKIAITIPYFHLVGDPNPKGPFRFGERARDGKYNEIAFVTMAIDANGVVQRQLDFNVADFPNVRVGDRQDMLGHGTLIYGPRNPGDFVAVSVLAIERDRDVRDLGKSVEQIVKSKAVELGAGAAMAANPTAGLVVTILRELTELVARSMQENKDDRIYWTNGTYFRDRLVPYDVERQLNTRVEVAGNHLIEFGIKVIELERANGLGREPTAIVLG
ncbi:MAG: hypothetical protein AAF995_02600 [Planctomycetota bacterium]